VTATGASWTITRGIETPFNVALGFAAGAVIQQVLTAAGHYAAGPFVNVRQFGAVGDGVTDDTTAINNAITYAAALGVAGGATVYLPPGTYSISSTIALAAQVRLLGAGREATRIKRSVDVVIVSVYGYGTTNHAYYSAIEHMTLDCNGSGATGLDCVYASQLMVYDLWVYNVQGIAVDCVEVWDSHFINLFCQWAAGIMVTEQPAVYVRCSRATSGFGFGTDSSNEITFTNLHLEHFRAGALRIAPGLGATGNPNGIYVNKLKLESPYVSNTTPPVYIDASTTRIHIDRVYGYIAALQDGSAVPLIQNNCGGQSSIRDVYAANAGVATLVSAVNVGISASGLCILDGIYGDYGTAPTTAHVNATSATTPIEITNLRTNLGTLITGADYDGGTRAKRITGSAVTNTSTSITDITALMFSNVMPGQYTLEFRGLYQSSVTTDGPRFAFGGTATCTDIGGAVAMGTSTTTITTSAVTAINTAVGTNPGTSATSFQVWGWCSVTVTAAGTFGLRWLESAASTGTLGVGSSATLTRTN
jgi:hypothetical protein